MYWVDQVVNEAKQTGDEKKIMGADPRPKTDEKLFPRPLYIASIQYTVSMASSRSIPVASFKLDTILKPPFDIPEIELKMIWSPLLHHDASHIWFRQLVIEAANEQIKNQ